MVKVKVFGMFRLDSGIRELEADVWSVKELYPLLLKRAREIDPNSKIKPADLDGCVVLVNGKQASKKTILKDGDEVALMSPVCGG